MWVSSALPSRTKSPYHSEHQVTSVNSKLFIIHLQHLKLSYHLRVIVCFVLGLGIAILSATDLTARSHKHPKKRSEKPLSKIHTTRLSREAELAKLQREIAETEHELREHSQREHRTSQSLAAYDKKTKKLKAKLVSFRSQVAELESQVEELDVSIQQTSSSIDTLKSTYASGVVRKYMNGTYTKYSADTTLFSGSKENADGLRDAYLGYIVSSAFHRNKNELDSTKSTLSENKEEVSATLNEELNQIDVTRRAQVTAEEQKHEQAEKLKEIQSSKQTLQKELDKRRASAKKLEGIIANLVAKEEADRRAKEKELKRRMTERKKKRSAGRKLSITEAQQEAKDKIEEKSLAGPHSLSWPTSSHKVVQSFGEHRNTELGTVTMKSFHLSVHFQAMVPSSLFVMAEEYIRYMPISQA